jgi:hypothetical protein
VSVDSKVRGGDNVTQPALAGMHHVRYAGYVDHLAVGGAQGQLAASTGDQGPTVRQEGHRPGFVQLCDLLDHERASVGTSPWRARR